MDWMKQYAAALDVRDARDRVHERYINSCRHPFSLTTFAVGDLVEVEQLIRNDKTLNLPIVSPRSKVEQHCHQST